MDVTSFSGFLSYISLLFLFHLPVYSQIPKSVFQTISTRDGLSHNRTVFLFQDKIGRLWISTTDGLNCYDGRTNRTFFQSETDSFSIADNNLSEIIEDNRGNIIVGTSKGFSIFNSAKDKFQNRSIPERFSANDAGLTNLLYDNLHHYWFASRFNVFELDSSFRIIRRLNHQLTGSDVFEIAQDSNNNIWINKSGFMNLLERSTHRIFNRDNNPGKKEIFYTKHSSGFVIDFSGHIWCIKDEKLLLEYDSSGHLLKSVPLPAGQRIQRLYITGGRKIWLNNEGEGVHCYNVCTHQFKSYLRVVKERSLSGGVIRSVLEDNFGNVWFATDNGLNVLPHAICEFNELFNNRPFSGKENAEFSFNHFLIEKENAYISLWKKGIVKLDFTSNKSQLFIPGPSDFENCIFDMIKSGDEIWFGNFKGLNIFNVVKGKFIQLESRDNYPSFLDSTAVVSFFRDNDSLLWISLFGDKGIIKYDPSLNTFRHFSINSTDSSYIPLRHYDGIAQDRQGKIWMGYGRSNGLIYLDKKKGVFQQFLRKGKPAFNHNVQCLLAEGDNLWIGSVSGLYRMNILNDELKLYSRNEGLINNWVRCMAMDSKGRLWLGTDGGLSILDSRSGNIYSSTTDNNLPENVVHQIVHDPVKKRMYLLTDHQFFWTSTDSLDLLHPKAIPYISSIYVMGLRRSYNPDSVIKINPDDKYFSVEFSAPCFFASGKINYAYRLEGYDTTWIPTGNKQIAGFTGLPHGKYVFHLKASFDGINWYELNKPLKIIIDTPFYLKQWFMFVLTGILIVIGVGIVIIYYRIKIRRIVLVQAVRNRIASDLHDDIGSSLSSISYMSEIAKQKTDKRELEEWFNLIGERSRIIMENMNDIIWSVNPQNDTYENLLTKMGDFAYPFLDLKNIRLTITTDHFLEKKKLSMNHRRNLYLIFKESINNIARHSQCRNVLVSITEENGFIKMMIRDDGKGFDTSVKYSGNGLRNLKIRTEEIGASLTIRSEIGRGSEFCIIF